MSETKTNAVAEALEAVALLLDAEEKRCEQESRSQRYSLTTQDAFRFQADAYDHAAQIVRRAAPR